MRSPTPAKKWACNCITTTLLMYRYALLLLRLIALVGLLVNAATLLANIAQSYDTFNPSYAGFFVKQQLARPVVGLVLSLAVMVCARPLARLIARGTES